MIIDENFKDKYCRLETQTKLVLYGLPRQLTEQGVFFETEQKYSFINWYEIKYLIPTEKEEKEC